MRATRVISKFGKHVVNVQRDRNEVYGSGMVKEIQRGLAARFQPNGLLAHERELALAKWTGKWNGQYQNMDEATPVPPDYRIGVFDSQQAQIEYEWTDEERKKVEDHLVHHAENFEELIVVPRTMLKPPWPRYDDYTGSPSALVRKLVDEGHDLQQTLEYERSTQKRETVIAAIEEALSEPGSVVEETIVG